MQSVLKSLILGLLPLLFFFPQASADEIPPEAKPCLTQARNHLNQIADHDKESDYDLSIAKSEQFGEQSWIYFFHHSIINSWEIELMAFDCFPVRIEFVGDL